MKKYSTIHPLYMSFFSEPLYKDVGSNWKGIAFLYLLLLLALSWIPVMFKLQAKLNDFIANEAPKLVEQIPEIRIIRGEVNTNAVMPYIIKDPQSGEPFIVIDTTGQVNSLDGSKARVLLTKSKLVMEKNPVETRTFDLSQIEEFIINRSAIYAWMDVFRKWAVIVSYPFVLVFSFIYRTVQVLLYAAIGILFAKRLKANLNYQALVSLSIVALTPAVIINTIYSYTDIKISFWWLICFAIAMGYLYFGIKANSGRDSEIKT